MVANKKKKISELFNFLPKSKIKAGEGMENGKYPFYTCSNELTKYYDEYTFEPNKLIFGTGGSASLHYASEPFATSTDCYVIETKELNVDVKYVYYYLKNNFQILEDGFKGAGLKHISKDYLSNIMIEYPDIEEQQRIVNILDKAEEIRTKKKLANEKLDEFLKSTFIDMFGDPEFNNKNWEKVVIRDVVKDVKYGTSSKAGLTGTYPILRMGNLTYNGAIALDDLKYIDLKESEIDKYTVHKGDILFNRTNSKELVGKTAVYRGTNTVAFAGYLVRVRTNNLAHYEFLSAFMNSSYMKKKLQMKCKNIVGMANINAQEFQDFDIYLPPIDLQNQFAQIVQKVEAQKEKNQKVIEQMDNLFNSLMQQAFNSSL